MLDTQGAPDSGLWQKIVGALLLVIGVLGALLKGMQAKLARVSGKPTSIDDAVRNVVHTTMQDYLRDLDQRFNEMEQQRTNDRVDLQREIGAIYRAIDALSRRQ